jgi:hypothetical protein
VKKLIWTVAGLAGLTLVSCKVSNGVKMTPTVKEIPHDGVLLHTQEIDDGNDTITLKSSYKVVDPNSTLVVTLDNSALKDKIAGSELSPAVTERLGKLKEMLAAEPQALQNIADALTAYNKDPNSNAWQDLLQQESDFTRLILRDKDSRKLFTTRFPQDAGIQSQYENLFKTATLVVAEIEDKITQEAKTNGVYVQLGAWVGSGSSQTPIHIPGFDDYSSQPAYTVERFQYTLTQEQQNELTDIAGLAKSANKNGLGEALMSTIKDSGMLKPIDSLPAVKLAIKLEAQLASLLKSNDTLLSRLKTPAQNSYTALMDFTGFITASIQSFKVTSDTVSAPELLNIVNNDIGEISTKVQILETTLRPNVQTILNDTTVIGNSTTHAIQTVAKQLTNLSVSLQTDLGGFKAAVGSILGAFGAGASLAQQSYDFAKQVKMLSIDQLPRQAIINLETAGKRSEGDIVIIKLATSKPAAPIVEQALVQYRLYFCAVYAKTATGFLFVNQVPLFKTVNNSALFRYAASYSILLKGFWKSAEGSRTHLAYHTLWTPGIGLNFATLNFNPNGATELGIGAVFTLLQDFIQIGYGINTFSGAGYAFFGFKITIGSFSLH